MFHKLNITTHKGSTSFGNPTFTWLKSPNGKDCIVVTYFLFSEGAEEGEAGKLIFYKEFDFKRNETYSVSVHSNSTISSDVNVNESEQIIGFNVTGPDNSKGFCIVKIPQNIVQDWWEGTIEGFIELTQTGDVVNIKRDATDSCNHHITGVTLIEANWLTSETEAETTPIPIKPGTLEDIEIQVAETVEHYPNIALYRYERFKRILIKSGYVKWDEKQFSITTTEKVKYVTLSFLSGPYGNPFGPMYVTVIARDYA